MNCRTLDEVLAAADGHEWPPLTQDQADYVAAVLASANEPTRAAA